MTLHPPPSRRCKRRFFGARIAVTLLGTLTGALATALIEAPAASAETLRDAITTAWSMDPAMRSARIDMQAAHRTARATDSLFPGGPILNGEYLDDHFIGTNLGYTTYQGAIMVPLWLPGQGTATVNNALADEAVSRANIKVARLATATRVLEITSTATLLEREIASLQATDTILAHMVRDLNHALGTGEIPATDQEAVLGEKEDVESRLATSRQKLEVARAELAMLTGSEVIPDLLSLDGRTLAARGSRLDPARDPRLEMAHAAIRSARAAYQVARHSYIPAPEVGLMVTRQGQYGSPWDTQVGAEFSVALPSAARNTPQLMKATSAVGAAERDAVQAERRVTVEYSQTRAQLASALEILAHAHKAQMAFDRRADQLEHAWQVGEMPLIESLRARRAALDAQLRTAQADVIWHAAMVRIILMAGDLP